MNYHPNRGKLEAAQRELVHMLAELFVEHHAGTNEEYADFEAELGPIIESHLKAAELMGRHWAADELYRDANSLLKHFNDMPTRLKEEKCACIPPIVKDLKRQSQRYLSRSHRETPNS